MSQELNYSHEHEAYTTADGEPFKSMQAAKTFAAKNNITEAEFIPIGTGFGVQGRKIDPIEKPAGPPSGEKYYRVMFGAKSSPTDPEMVELHVNFETLVIQRGKEVVIPARFKECAEHALYPQYKQEPGRERKVAGYRQIFPFSVLGEGTKAEYLKSKKDGTKRSMKDFEKHGFNGKAMDD